MKIGSLALVAMPLLSLAADNTALANAYVHGSICQPQAPEQRIIYTSYGARSDQPTSGILWCPVPVDHSVGQAIQFDVLVDDETDTLGVKCIGYAFDAAGQLVAQTPAVETGKAFMGEKVLTTSFTVTSTDANINYVMVCGMPPGGIGSSVRYVRVN